MALCAVSPMDTRKAIKDLQERITRLEGAVFRRRPTGTLANSRTEFVGATGGIRLLISKGFFDRKRTFPEIRTALAGQGYHYSKQAVQTPLNALSKPGSQLVAFREQGRKVYAKRK